MKTAPYIGERSVQSLVLIVSVLWNLTLNVQKKIWEKLIALFHAKDVILLHIFHLSLFNEPKTVNKLISRNFTIQGSGSGSSPWAYAAVWHGHNNNAPRECERECWTHTFTENVKNRGTVETSFSKVEDDKGIQAFWAAMIAFLWPFASELAAPCRPSVVPLLVFI